MLSHGIEQKVQLVEMHALHVPVRVLDLSFQIEGIGKPGIQHLYDLMSDWFRKVNTGRNQTLTNGSSHDFSPRQMDD
jgi:hypothetical protein